MADHTPERGTNMEPDTTPATQASPARRTRRRSAWRRACWLAVPVAAALIAGALPAAAGAADYCVAPNTGCGGTNVASFEQALDQADNATDADRIFLGAATYTAPTANGFSYAAPSSPVEIVGQGIGQTTLTSPAGGNSWVLRLIGGAGSSVQDLTIRLPQNAADGFSGLNTANAARRIKVIEVPAQVSDLRYGVGLVNGATLEDSSVTLDGQLATVAVSLMTPDVAVRRSTLSARTGAESWGGTIERSRVTGANVGLFAKRGLTSVAGSLIQATGSSSNAVFAEPEPGTSTTVNADGVTLIGPGSPNTYGAAVANETSLFDSASINLSNAVIRGFSAPLFAASSGAGQFKVAASYSDYDPSGNFTIGPNAVIAETNVSNVGDARFVDPTGGDYRLLPGSPLLDTGDPATAQGLDLDGNPLVADGNGDGTARRDLGAFELPPAPSGGQPPAAEGQQGGGGGQAQLPALDTQAPLIGSFRATPSLFAVARAGTPLAARTPRGTRLRYTLSEAAKVTLKIQRALAGRPTRYRTIGTLSRTGARGANSTRFSGRLRKRALRPGRYRVRITATDTAGNRSARRTTRFRIAAS
jgi:hypothetical protein